MIRTHLLPPTSAPDARDGSPPAASRRPLATAPTSDGEVVPLAPSSRLRPTWVEIDLDAVTHNAAAITRLVGDGRLMAVVKADGYGHGMVPVARAALRGGASWLAVALVEEGRELRAAGIDVPTLLLTEPPASAIGALLDARLTPTVYTPAFVAALDAAVAARGVGPVAVHCKLDTGMRRVGAPEADWDTVLGLLARSPNLHVEALWSHLACADHPGHASIASQATAFRRGLDAAARHGLSPTLRHLCNSAGALTLPDEHFELVRCGIVVYGLDPGGGLLARIDARPALRWVSRVSLVKRVAAGEAVSYGHHWTAPRDTTIGTVPAGYADGVTRALGGRGSVLVGGRRRPIVGRVCMDQFMFDAGDDPVAVGDEVVLIGRQGDGQVTAEDWAAWLDTITYEIATTVGARVPRTYHGGPDEAAVAGRADLAAEAAG